MFIGNAYGNLGKDWEIRNIQSGKKVASTTMAIRQRNGDPLWVGLTVWNEKAMDTLKQYTFKGSSLFVSGSVSMRTWEGQNGKPNGAQIEINVQDFALTGKREDKKTNDNGGGFEDDIPFSPRTDLV
jgi:single-strand DNA-binding protein